MPLDVHAQADKPFHQTPPAPYAIPVEQPDGSLIHLFVRGDQAYHWTETLDGYTIVKNTAGYHEYAIPKNGRLVGNGQVAQDPTARSLSAQRKLLSLARHQKPPNPFKALSARTAAASPASAARTLNQASMPSSGKVRLLAICIDYPDYPATYKVEDFLRLFNGPNNGLSFSDYFKENSYGKLDVRVDVIGWTRAKNNYQSYSHGRDGFSGARPLVTEAIDAAEARGVDFSLYDNNSDGNVDGVIIIHSGPGAEETGDDDYVWSHRSAIDSRYYDGRNVSDYIIQPEIRFNGRVNIGVFCHEFGHLLGLPDLYDTDYENGTDSGIGHWGLMARGGWAGLEAMPTGLSAWSKSALDWADVQDITGEYGAYTLRAASQNNAFFKIRTPRSNEYFLLENRQQTGVDAELPGSGMAIWHVDSDKTAMYPNRNEVNGDTDRKGVDLEEADGRDELDALPFHAGDAGDVFPGTTGNTAFSPRSYPHSNTYVASQGSTNSGVNLQDIRLRDGIISFTYRKEGANVGTSCDEPATAVVGGNEAERTVNWYELILPADGVVSMRSSGKPSSVRVYADCQDDPLEQEGGSEIVLDYMSQGQRLLIRWEFAERPTRPVAWQISLENSVVRTDSLALVALYQTMEGARWSKRGNWLQGKVASWEGVRTARGRVTELHFEQVGLKNSFPNELYQLTGLKKFVVTERPLAGEVSAEFVKLTELEEVRIEVPGLPVRFLKDVGKLTNLRSLRLAGTAVGSTLPTSIANLSQLERLELPNTQLGGELPAGLGEISTLSYLDLSQNNLTGSVPAALFESNLAYLDLHDNRLESLAGNLLTSSKLRACYLHNNLLAGGLPRDVSRSATAPLTLTLARNQFTGSVPESWTDVAFEELTLNNNQLAGSLPALSMPKKLDISANRFTALPALPNARSSAGELICHTNQLTFEDLLPNRQYLNCADCQGRYTPQADVVVTIDRGLKAGEAASIELPFDKQVANSRYVWYHQNEVVSQTDANTLAIQSFTNTQAGLYECRISNPGLPGLTLRATGIKLSLQEKELQTLSLPAIESRRFGDAPFVLAGQSSAGLPVTYQKVAGPVTLDNNRVTIQGAGEVTINMVAAGNDTYAPAERTIQFTIAKAKPVIRSASVPTKTFGDAPFILDAHANDDLSVRLILEEGNVTLDRRTITIQGAGAVRIRATRPEDQDYETAEPVVISFVVEKADQGLTFAPLEDVGYKPEGEIPLVVQTSSDLVPVYEVIEGGVGIENGVAIIQQAGLVTLRVSQPGNENYRAASAQQQSFVITKAPQEIFFSRIDSKLTADSPFQLNALSSVALPLAFRVVSGPAAVRADGLVTIQGVGEVVIEASQEGNQNYLAALPVMQQFLVQAPDRESQQIIVNVLPDTVVIGQSVTLEATTSSGLETVVTVDGPATLTEQTLSFTEEGLVTLQISQPGNSDYNPALTYTKIIAVLKSLPTIEPQGQTLVFGQANRQFGESIVISTAQGDRATVEVVAGPAQVTEAGTVVTTGTGTVRIKTTHPGNDRLAPVDTVLEFLVTPASQQLVFEAVSLSDSTFRLQATAGSGLPVAYTVESGEATLRGDTLIARSDGVVVVTARQGGNENYFAADPVSKSFEVNLITANHSTLEESAVEVYPNPSRATFYVRLAPAVTWATYRVVNTQGQQLLGGRWNGGGGSLSLGHLAGGTYFLYLQTRQGVSYHRLLKE